MKNLTLYYIKKRLPIFLIVLGIVLTGTIVYLGTADFYGYRQYFEDGVLKKALSIFDTGISDLTLIALALATLVPIYEFSFKMKKTGCDLFYSLPVKRSKLYLFKYLFGICEMLAIMLINFAVTVIAICIKFSDIEFTDMTFTPSYYFLYLIVIILLAIVVFTWVAFFYTRANTFYDGIISVVASSIVLLVIVHSITVFGTEIKWLNANVYGYSYSNGAYYTPYGSSFNLAFVFDNLIKGIAIEDRNIGPSLIGIGITAISIPLFIVFFSKERAEESEDISDSMFIYKTMIPIYIITTFMVVKFNWGIWIGIVIGGYIGYVIHNRNFKLRKNDWIAYASSVGLGLVLMIISSTV